MNRFLVLTVIVIAAAGLSAAPIACPQSGSLNVLTGMTAEGCLVQDKIFSNFQYTPASGGLAATAVNFNLVTQTGTSDIHGWSFVPTTAWQFGFTLSYDIAIAPGFPLVRLIESKDQIQSGATTPPNGISVVDTQTFGTLNPVGTPTGETQYLFYSPATVVHTSSVATIPAGTNLLTYEQDFFEQTVPEPVSFVLIGSGLLGLGLLRRRVRKS